MIPTECVSIREAGGFTAAAHAAAAATTPAIHGRSEGTEAEPDTAQASALKSQLAWSLATAAPLAGIVLALCAVYLFQHLLPGATS